MADTANIRSLTALPDDPEQLRAMVEALLRRQDEMAQRMSTLELKSARLELELLKYKKWYYGPRADRLESLSAVAQMLLDFGESLDARPIDAQDGVEGEQTPTRRVTRSNKPRRGRRNLGAAAFDHLPVTRHEHDLTEDEKPCPCCGTPREKIGEESSWQIEFVPGHFERLEHVRYKYACKHCEQNASSDGPQIVRADKLRGAAPIDKGLAGPGLLAFVVTSKFGDYLPLYRLERIFERGGFAIARSTLSLWCRDVAEIAETLYKLMVERVRASKVIGTDETIMPMQSPGDGKARRARMWVYVGDEDNPYNIFDFTLGRSRDGPMKFLKGYKGVLLADAYGGYDGVVVGNGEGGITRAGCWAHARRKFIDAQATNPTIAAEAVKIIGSLYAIEERGKALDASSRAELRRAEGGSASILAVFKEKLYSWRDGEGGLLPKHPMAQAIGYALNQWETLTVFASGHEHAGHVSIDNNASEREMKRIVLNRKNSLFVGNERAGRTSAILSSLTSTCRRHGIDPQRYLTQLLAGLPSTPVSRLEHWLPDRWKRNDPPPPTP